MNRLLGNNFPLRLNAETLIQAHCNTPIAVAISSIIRRENESFSSVIDYISIRNNNKPLHHAILILNLSINRVFNLYFIRSKHVKVSIRPGEILNLSSLFSK